MNKSAGYYKKLWIIEKVMFMTFHDIN